MRAKGERSVLYGWSSKVGGVRGRVGLHWGRPIIDTGLNFLSVKTVSEDDLQLRRLMIPITIYCYDCSNGMTDKENIEKKSS